MIEVSTADLRRATTLLLDYLDQNGHCTIRVDHDYYSEILDADRFNLGAQPNELGVGSLCEDIEDLRRILARETEPLGYGLVWLAAILDAIGRQVVE
jgi:hypothetical protein